MKKISDFEVMQMMSDKDDHSICMSPYFIESGNHPGGGYVKMGISRQVHTELFLNPEKYLCALYIVDKHRFNELKAIATPAKNHILQLKEALDEAISGLQWRIDNDLQNTDKSDWAKVEEWKALVAAIEGVYKLED